MTVAERYLLATASKDLRLVEPRRKDADWLVAAAYASAQCPWKRLALRVLRVQAGDTAGVRHLAGELGEQMREHFRREGGRRHAGTPKMARLEPVVAADLALMTLRWMQRPRCRTCEGRGHPTIPGTPTLDTTRECHACHGTGLRSLERLVKHEHVEHARWLVSRVDRACADVMGDMRRIAR